MRILSHLRAVVPFMLLRRAPGPRILPLDQREQQLLEQARSARAERLARRAGAGS